MPVFDMLGLYDVSRSILFPPLMIMAKNSKGILLLADHLDDSCPVVRYVDLWQSGCSVYWSVLVLFLVQLFLYVSMLVLGLFLVQSVPLCWYVQLFWAWDCVLSYRFMFLSVATSNMVATSLAKKVDEMLCSSMLVCYMIRFWCSL